MDSVSSSSRSPSQQYALAASCSNIAVGFLLGVPWFSREACGDELII